MTSAVADYTVKLMVLGNMSVGKTCMLLTLINGHFPLTGEYIPTVLDTCSTILQLNQHTVKLELVDTAISEEYECSARRPLPLEQAHVILLCFSCVDRSSFENVSKAWINLVRKNCPTTPVVLCGTKIDLRDVVTDRRCTYEEGIELAKQTGAASYVECSAKQSTVLHVFSEAVQVAIDQHPAAADSHERCVAQ